MNPFKPTLFTTFILTAGNIQLDFPYITTTNTATNITFIGDSSLRNRIVSLTKATTFSTGSIIYNKPISLFNILTNTTCSFSTTFSFSITKPNNPTSFVAVEFDTHLDPRFNDPNENYIGFEFYEKC
jgi:hypothetical protein